MTMNPFFTFLRDNMTWLKDFATLIFAGVATILAILTYRRARATILQPIRSEVIKRQSELLSDLLKFLKASGGTIDERLDYIQMVTVNAYVALKEFGFLLKEQEHLDEQIKSVISSWRFYAVAERIQDVAIVGVFKDDTTDKPEADDLSRGKRKFQDAQKGIVTIDKIGITNVHDQYYHHLLDFAENPFLPAVIQSILKQLVQDIDSNRDIALRKTIEEFVKNYFRRHLETGSYPTIAPAGVYNEFNHSRIHHAEQFEKLKDVIRKYLMIDAAW
jgi:hypothetical protein